MDKKRWTWKKILRNSSGIILFFIGLVIIMYIRLSHIDETEMRIFVDHFPTLLGGSACMIVGVYLLEEKKSHKEKPSWKHY